MEPTLSIGQRVLVNRLGIDFCNPSVGEIVVFHPPEGAEQRALRQDDGPRRSVRGNRSTRRPA